MSDDRLNTQTLPLETSRQLTILILFFLSGFSALIYEIIWFRMLAVVFGSTVYASTTVLSSFMGGLAIGSYLFGNIADRIKRPVRLYGLLEIGIAAFAILFPFILKFYDNLYVAVHQKLSISFYALSLGRFIACFAVLIIPTTLMGGTFPVISKFYVRSERRMTANIGNLYAINTIGAVMGVVMTGFIFIPSLGIQRSTVFAIIINLAVGAAALLVSSRIEKRAMPAVLDRHREASSDTRKSSKAFYPSHLRPFILVAVFIAGATSLAYEVLWTRTLVFILDSFVYSFSIMLATFLVGIAIGSAIMARIAGKLRKIFSLFCILEAAIGVTTLLALPFFMKIALWKDSYLESISTDIAFDAPAPWLKYILFKFLVSFLIMAVPTLIMGAAFPLAMRLYTETIGSIGRKVGVVYASNTLGAIIGSFAAGFILIPFMGLSDAFLLVATLNVLTGIMLYTLHTGIQPLKRAAWATLGVAVLAGTAFSVPDDIYKKIFQKAEKQYDLVFYKEDPTATVTVHKRGPDRLIIDLNGLNVAGTSFNFLTTQKIQAHLGLLLHPNPKRVMQIGFGSGGTCHSVSQHKSVKVIDCVELCPAVIEAAKYFLPSNHRVLENPIVHLTIEDARNYVLATPERYDIILSDSIHPTYAGNGTLYSQDYFELCKNKLNPGGYVSFWLPLYLLSVRDYKTIIKTFQSVFPYVSIWHVNSAIEAYTIVIGRVEPFSIDIARLREKIKDSSIARDLASVSAYDEFDIMSYFVMGPEKARIFASEGDINSDDRPFIEFRAPKSMSRRRTWYLNLQALSQMREMPTSFFENTDTGDEMKTTLLEEIGKRFRASGLLIEGHLTNVISYEFQKEHEYYSQALAILPDNRTIQRLHSLAQSRVFVLDGEKALKERRLQEAAAAFQRAIEVNPDSSDDSVGHSYFRIGYLLVNQNNPAAAQAMLTKCLDIFPNHRNALYLSAVIAGKTQNSSLARMRLKKLFDLYPRDAEAKKLARSLNLRI